MAMKEQYEFWSGRLIYPTKHVDRVINSATGAVIYQKGERA
jgi:hypothetical protein